FFIFHEQKRPYIILKWASTADGFIAPPDRQRYAITNSFTQQLVHRWRTEETAIMVGYRTAIHDNPQLTSRLWQGPQPLRIVTDRNLQLPESYHLLDDSAPTWVLNELKDETRGSIRYIRTSFDKKMLPTLMEELHAQGK